MFRLARNAQRKIQSIPSGRTASAYCRSQCRWSFTDPNYIRVSDHAQRHCAETGHDVAVISTALTLWRIEP